MIYPHEHYRRLALREAARGAGDPTAHPEVVGGVLEAESREILQAFFRARRGDCVR